MSIFTNLVPIPLAQAYAEFRAAFAALPPGASPTDVNEWRGLRDSIRETLKNLQLAQTDRDLESVADFILAKTGESSIREILVEIEAEADRLRQLQT
jgi:hypothetical protein